MENVVSPVHTGAFNVFLNCSQTHPIGITIYLKEYHNEIMYDGRPGVGWTYFVFDNTKAGIEYITFKVPSKYILDNYSVINRDYVEFFYKTTIGAEYAYMKYWNRLPSGVNGPMVAHWAASYNGYTTSNTRPPETPVEPWWKTTVTIKLKDKPELYTFVFGPVCE